jgi:hypothetical protein
MHALGVALVIATALAGSAAAAARYESAFTTLAPDECRLLPGGIGAPDTSLHECPGHDGVRVLLAEQDVRRWLRLRVARDETDLRSVITGSDTPGVEPRRVATPLEWRYRVDGERRDLVALIMRVTGAPGEPQQMIVMRVTQGVTFCVLAYAVPTETAAREYADGTTVCHWTMPHRKTS